VTLSKKDKSVKVGPGQPRSAPVKNELFLEICKISDFDSQIPSLFASARKSAEVKIWTIRVILGQILRLFLLFLFVIPSPI
jgi:hypothetical protein